MTTTYRADTLRAIAEIAPGRSAATQRQRIMAALHRFGSVTTIECTRFLDVIHPPRRVMELREEGARIKTDWHRDATESGELHRVGLYVLETK